MISLVGRYSYLSTQTYNTVEIQEETKKNKEKPGGKPIETIETKRNKEKNYEKPRETRKILGKL